MVEHPFGTMKYYMGQIPILLRGKEKVQVEMDLYSTGYNLIRLKYIENMSLLFKKLARWNPIAGFFALLSHLFLKEKQYCLAYRYYLYYHQNKKLFAKLNLIWIPDIFTQPE